MAIEEAGLNFTNQQGAAQTANPTNANASIPTPRPEVISAKSNYLQDLTAGLFSAFGAVTDLSSVKEKVEEILKPRNKGIKVAILDRNAIPGLAYSCLVFYKKYDNAVRYYTVLYTKSGRIANTARQTVQIAMLQQQDRSNKKSRDLYTYSDCIDEELQRIVVNQLRLVDHEVSDPKLTFHSLDGLVLRYNVPIESVIAQFTNSAYSAFVIAEYGEAGRGLNLPLIRDSLRGNCELVYNLEPVQTGVVSDKLGNPVKADFVATIALKDNNVNNAFSPNTQSADQTLVTVAGYITGLPVKAPNIDKRMNVNGVIEPFVTAIAPNIIITLIDAAVPDTASALLGLVAATLVADEKQYVKIVMDTMTKDRQPGVYNYFTREAVDAKGQVMEVDVSDRKLSPNEKALLIDSIYTHAPIITLDATVCCQGYDALSAFVFSDTQPAAQQAIFNAASILTNGKFAQFHKPIVCSRNIIPAGSWRAKDSERDIRDLEFEAILAQTNGADETAINLFIDSLAPGNARSYNDKVELLGSFIEDAEMEYKTVRMVIEPEFVVALANALMTSGISFRFDNKFKMPASGFNIDALKLYAQHGLASGAYVGLANSSLPTIGEASYNSYGLYNNFGQIYQ